MVSRLISLVSNQDGTFELQYVVKTRGYMCTVLYYVGYASTTRRRHGRIHIVELCLEWRRIGSGNCPLRVFPLGRLTAQETVDASIAPPPLLCRVGLAFFERIILFLPRPPLPFLDAGRTAFNVSEIQFCIRSYATIAIRPKFKYKSSS